MSTPGLIFDFDGVVILSEHVHGYAWGDLAAQYDRPLPAGFLETGTGRPDAELASELVGHWGVDIPSTTLLERKRANYQARVTESVLVPGVFEALQFFSKRYPLAVATSSTMGDIEPSLRAYGLERFFSAILTVDSVIRPKPDPEIYLKAAARLGVDPRECWVFEDSISGASAARAAGSRVIGVTTTLTPRDLAPVEAAIPDFQNLDTIVRLIRGE